MAKNRNKSIVKPSENPMNDNVQTEQTTTDTSATETVQDTASTNEQATSAPETQAAVQEQSNPEPEQAPVVQTPAPAPAPAPAVAPAVAPVVEAAPAKTLSKLERMVQKAMTTGTTTEKQLISFFNNYIDVMAPGKPMDSKKGAGHQQTLWRGILTALNDDENFDKSFPLMIEFVKEHRKGVFSDSYAFRFTEQMTLSKEQLAAFNSFIVTLQIAAGLVNKKDMSKQVDLNKLMTPVYKEATRQRLIAYFS